MTSLRIVSGALLIATLACPALALAQTPAQGPTGAQATSSADSQATALAKQTQNPVFSLISVPLQANWDFGLGDREATGTVFNIQPAMPFAITPSRRPVNFQIAGGTDGGQPRSRRELALSLRGDLLFPR